MVSTRWEYLGAGRLAGLTLYLGCAEWRETKNSSEKKKRVSQNFPLAIFFAIRIFQTGIITTVIIRDHEKEA